MQNWVYVYKNDQDLVEIRMSVSPCKLQLESKLSYRHETHVPWSNRKDELDHCHAHKTTLIENL